MKQRIAIGILILADILLIYLALVCAIWLLGNVQSPCISALSLSSIFYTKNVVIYGLVLFMLWYEQIYRYRFDFWEETRLVWKGLIFAFFLLMGYLALSKSLHEHSRLVLGMAFVLVALFLPIGKNLLKKRLFRIGLWQREAEVCGNDHYISEEIFGNAYLGYVQTDHAKAQTIFVDSHNVSLEELHTRLEISMKEKKEVLFIPLLQNYNFTGARIIELSNARKNLVVFENALLKPTNILLKKVSDVLLSVMVFPLLLLVFALVIFLMKREEPKGQIFFKQDRMGKDGKTFVCYKFRSMYENGDAILEDYLKEHTDEIACYDKFHKYKNDPRITKIGKILRKTSLDEIPQIINVFRGEMSLIGPRPYMLNEKEKIGDDLEMVLAVKPGITGLWQVSGRSDVDFYSRVEMDTWYTRNWSLWLDLVILVKTVRVVLFRDGAS